MARTERKMNAINKGTQQISAVPKRNLSIRDFFQSDRISTTDDATFHLPLSEDANSEKAEVEPRNNSKPDHLQNVTDETQQASSEASLSAPLTPPSPYSPQTPCTPPSPNLECDASLLDDRLLLRTPPSPPSPSTFYSTQPQGKRQKQVQVMNSCTLPNPSESTTMLSSHFGTPSSVTIGETNRRKIHTPSSTSVSKKGNGAKNQMYLDFGQRTFGKRTICQSCGMMYVHGVQEDADDHERICVEYKLGVRLGQPWKQERVAWTQSKKGDRIIEIRPTDPVHHRKKVRQVKAIVDDELGFVSQSINKQAANQFSNIQCGQNEIENGADLYGKTAFLYIDSKSNRVVGLCTAHVIKKAFLLITQEENGIPHNNNGSICRSTVPVRAMVGVHQIWVHKSHRTKGIATYLVDAVRSRLIYGCTIPPDQVAFSSPTADGAAFAKRYMGVDKSGGNDNSNVLIYDAHT